MKPRAFFFHYNKPASLQAGRAQISVHHNNACHLVDNIVCNVPVRGRVKNTQPRFVMAGRAASFEYANGQVVIS